MADCMDRAARREEQRRRYRDQLPAMVQTVRDRDNDICSRILQLSTLQYNDLVKQIMREFGETWDNAAYLASETRNAAKRERLQTRNNRIVEMRAEGLTYREIAGELNLSPGTVRNIVSRLNRPTASACIASAPAA